MLELQSKWWAGTLSGRIELPSEEEMIEDVKTDYEKVEMKGWPKRYTHNLDFQVVYMALVGSFPFNSFLSGILSCIGTAVLAVCLCIQVNKDNKEFKQLPSPVGLLLDAKRVELDPPSGSEVLSKSS
ncbi:Dolichyl-diphosphooligosaccharide--protein [Carex littledalei]|uniref:Dolichyl-diphosphooligosaccharide--protein glycosyltransferase subunit DAD1 n=1 Tax=Carex littledalei TaxID=544730 RepID=A0A833QRQ9_9POAL|nr:Dolichyl-diphosphooligosaccharide--protein [Carex littledalei]